MQVSAWPTRSASGAPSQVVDLTARTRDLVGDRMALRFHFHNTRNTGFANAYAAVAEGVDVLDERGRDRGCPFAPKATGIATDDLVYMLERMGRPTGIDLTTLLPTAGFLSEQLGHEVPRPPPRWTFVSEPASEPIQPVRESLTHKLLRSHLTAGELSPGPTSPSPSTRS